MVWTSARTSSQAAWRLGTGRSSEVAWLCDLDVDRPSAPALMAPSSWSCIARTSSSVPGSSKARSPITYVRRAEWPTYPA